MRTRDRRRCSKKRFFESQPVPVRWSNRAWKAPALLTAVRTLLLARPKLDFQDRVSAEEICSQLRAKKSMVTAALERLRDEGIIGHKIKGFCCEGNWRPSTYPIRKQR